ncbi:hypothetical protein ATANTOWER_006615 [Ataeniobius toweri]|uniref:Uncharacterized protein n=1 Tax=Ataeniobius toweri TaxID=208326 RepID=A0ABU7AN40_9TELE|nr:hypothetical protein [Ataeniobius toweri]
MASRTKFYTVAEALDLITMDYGTEVCAEDFSSEDEYLFYPDKLNDELDFAVPPLEMEVVGKMVGAGGKEGFSSSRNNPIPREDEPNFHPAALNFTTMTTALDQEVAGERPLRLTCVGEIRCSIYQTQLWVPAADPVAITILQTCLPSVTQEEVRALGREVSSEEEAREIQEVSVPGFGVRLCSRSEGERESGRTEDGWFPGQVCRLENSAHATLTLEDVLCSSSFLRV